MPGDKIDENLLCVLEPAQYESVASHLTKRPDDQPMADGLVMGVLNMEAIAKRWLSHPAINMPPCIDIYIAANGKALVSRTNESPPVSVRGAAAASSAPTNPPVGGALASDDFEVSNANLTAVFVAPAAYVAECGSRKPLVTSLTGLFVTGLVVGYFWLLTGRMASVERQVAERWLELRERERYIRHLVDSTSDAIFLREEQGRILDVNSAPARASDIAARNCCR